MIAGCASRTPTLASRFIRQGKPTADFGGAAPRPRQAKEATVRPIVEVSRYSPSSTDVEARDPQLRAALLAVGRAPDVSAHLSAAAAYKRLGIFDRAYDHLMVGAALEPNNLAVLDATARVWRDWGMPGFGLSTAYRAVHLAPRSATARHTLGTLLYALGLRKDAQSAFQEVVRLDPQAWYGWQNLCTLVMAEGRTQEATILCQRAQLAKRKNARR